MILDNKNENQKEQVITEFHHRWSDPDSEIVKRMNSFVEKSPEILKPILEGIKGNIMTFEDFGYNINYNYIEVIDKALPSQLIACSLKK